MEQTTPRPLAGSTVLITGATRGIGYAAAEGLARMGARVVIHGRDGERVREVCRWLRQSAPGTEIDSVVADLGTLTAVRQLAVNHLAPFLLTHLLLDKLRANVPARIVNVSSMAHHRAAFDLDDLNWEKRRYSGIGAYGATKLANILFTRELARRLDQRPLLRQVAARRALARRPGRRGGREALGGERAAHRAPRLAEKLVPGTNFFGAWHEFFRLLDTSWRRNPRESGIITLVYMAIDSGRNPWRHRREDYSCKAPWRRDSRCRRGTPCRRAPRLPSRRPPSATACIS